MSSYKGSDLFGSGPHEFVPQRMGRRVISLAAFQDGLGVPGAAQFGELWTKVVVRGRLVASSESSLRSLVDDILDHTEDEDAGTLSDGNGRSWSNLKLLTFEPAGEIDRGRVYSLRYSVEFGELLEA